MMLYNTEKCKSEEIWGGAFSICVQGALSCMGVPYPSIVENGVPKPSFFGFFNLANSTRIILMYGFLLTDVVYCKFKQ